MNKKIAFPALCFFLIFGTAIFSLNLKRARATPSEGGKTLVLYDADLGTIPSAPLMNFGAFPTAATAPIYENRVTLLDTTTSGNSTYAGWISNAAATQGFPILDRIAGFQVDFTVQVENESHTNNNRRSLIPAFASHEVRRTYGTNYSQWRQFPFAGSHSIA